MSKPVNKFQIDEESVQKRFNNLRHTLNSQNKRSQLQTTLQALDKNSSAQARYTKVLHSQTKPKTSKLGQLLRLYAPLAVIALVLFTGGGFLLFHKNPNSADQSQTSQIQADGSINSTFNALTQDGINETSQAKSIDVNTASFSQTNSSVEQLGNSVNENY
jgi:hypothetical protein